MTDLPEQDFLFSQVKIMVTGQHKSRADHTDK
jgi:hypothetical protein